MSTKSERISEVLRGLRASSPEVIGACVVSSDGFIIASVVPNEIDEDLIGGGPEWYLQRVRQHR